MRSVRLTNMFDEMLLSEFRPADDDDNDVLIQRTDYSDADLEFEKCIEACWNEHEEKKKHDTPPKRAVKRKRGSPKIKAVTKPPSELYFGELATRRYQVIYADPPWSYSREGGYGVAKNHYNTMSDADILAMPVGEELADEDCALLMWATGPKLECALAAVRAWGFTFKTIYHTWIKVYKNGDPVCGVGSYTRPSTELLLLGVRGRPIRFKKSSSIRQTVLTPRPSAGGKVIHSAKPHEFRVLIENFFGEECRKIELFARNKSKGWRVWGNQAPENSDSEQESEEPACKIDSDVVLEGFSFSDGAESAGDTCSDESRSPRSHELKRKAADQLTKPTLKKMKRE